MVSLANKFMQTAKCSFNPGKHLDMIKNCELGRKTPIFFKLNVVYNLNNTFYTATYPSYSYQNAFSFITWTVSHFQADELY